MQDINATKERISTLVQQKGPSLPVQLARTINVSPLFTSVFLSELKEDNKLKTSYMRVGSSPLFYITGQEAQLENFIEHLNPREKEAFFLIKNSQILEDGKQTPVMRVALRAIKDFAIPFKVSLNNSEKIFWKYHLLKEEELDKKLQKIINPFAESEKPKPAKPETEEEKLPKEKIEAKSSTPVVHNKTEPSKIIQEETESTQIAPVIKSKPKRTSLTSEFAEGIKDYLASKDIEILSTILEKKKEYMAKVRSDTNFGKQEYYLIAKDKKKITETDITLALQKAQSEKMIALIISPGEIDKKASMHAKEWRNLVKFDKISF